MKFLYGNIKVLLFSSIIKLQILCILFYLWSKNDINCETHREILSIIVQSLLTVLGFFFFAWDDNPATHITNE